MAGRVTELRYQKRKADRVNVYIDGTFAFGLPDVEAARLRVGQYLSDDDVERLRTTDEAQKAYDRAVKFLSYRPRSEAEVRANLEGAGVPEELIEGVIERLRTQGYLDDAEFAHFWVENRERFRPRGSRALQEELRRKGVDGETAAAALSQVDAGASAYRAARPRAERLAVLLREDRVAFRRKLGDFLLRRGFGWDVVREVVAQIERELSNDAG